MKKTVIISSMLFVMLSCESKKGSWTLEDKQKARTAVKNAISSDGTDPAEFREVVECSVRRLELYYDNFEEVEFDEDGAKKYLGSVCGKISKIKSKIKTSNNHNSPKGSCIIPIF